jgi:integrase
VSAKGSIKREANGTYSFIVDLGRKPDGKRNQVRRRGFTTRKEADAALTQLKAEFENGGYVNPSKTTLSEFLASWIPMMRPTVSPKTAERYEQLIKNNLIPSLGRHFLQRLHPMHIQEAYTDWIENGRVDGKGGLSPTTIRQIHLVLHRALDQAVKWDLMRSNPATSVDLPKKVKPQIVFLDKSETAILLQAVKDHWLYPLILVAVTTGMRRGELLALRWNQLSLDSGVLRVRASLEETKNGLREKEPKTANGRRDITLPSVTIDELKKLRIKQSEDRLKLGLGRDDQGLVFADLEGNHLRPVNISDRFKKIAARIDGIPNISLQGLRHTHISHLLQDRHPIKTVSERAGHASVATTLDIYGHVLPNSQQELAAEYGADLVAIMEQVEN